MKKSSNICWLASGCLALGIALMPSAYADNDMPAPPDIDNFAAENILPTMTQPPSLPPKVERGAKVKPGAVLKANINPAVMASHINAMGNSLGGMQSQSLDMAKGVIKLDIQEGVGATIHTPKVAE